MNTEGIFLLIEKKKIVEGIVEKNFSKKSQKATPNVLLEELLTQALYTFPVEWLEWFSGQIFGGTPAEIYEETCRGIYSETFGELKAYSQDLLQLFLEVTYLGTYVEFSSVFSGWIPDKLEEFRKETYEKIPS